MTIKKLFRILFGNMTKLKIKEDYRLSNCCSPLLDNDVIGYYSHDGLIKVHVKDCVNTNSIDKSRLLTITWSEILSEEKEFEVTDEYLSLTDLDFKVLLHHVEYGIDYSLVVARKLNIDKQEAFDTHQKLKELNLIERVEAKEIQYRKGIVPNKWIKHRNHTYYNLTEKGESFTTNYLQSSS